MTGAADGRRRRPERSRRINADKNENFSTGYQDVFDNLLEILLLILLSCLFLFRVNLSDSVSERNF